MIKHKKTRCYYLVCGTKKVESAVFSHMETLGGNRRLVRYADGGWNDADHNFFSARQCRQFYGLLPSEGAKQRARIARQLADAERALNAAVRLVTSLQSQLEAT